MAAQRSSPATRTAMMRRADSSSVTAASIGGRLEALGGAGDDVAQRERAEHAEQVGDVLGVAGTALGRQPLELGLGAGHRLGVEQVTQGERLTLAEQLGEQRRVEGEGRSATLGERRVALVEVLGDVAEDERLREGARLARLDVDDLDAARADVGHQVDEARHVEDVLHALAHGLEHDGEGGVLARHLEQLRGPLPLLPQRLAAVGPTARQQQGPSSALPESCCEQGRSADLLRDELAHLLGLEGDELDELLADLAAADGVVELEVGQAEDDPVVAVHGLHVDAEALAHAGCDAERPRRVDLPTEGREHRDPPVADLVAEALDDDGAVVGDVARSPPSAP